MITLTEVENLEDELLVLNETYIDKKIELRDLHNDICHKQNKVMSYFNGIATEEAEKDKYIQKHSVALSMIHSKLHPKVLDDDLPDNYDKWIGETPLLTLTELLCKYTNTL